MNRNISLVLRDMSDGVIILQKNGQISYTNRRATEILMLDEEAVGKTPLELFMHDGKNEEFLQTILDAVYNKGMRYKRKSRYMQKGEERVVEMSATYTRETEVLTLVVSDVTEREKMLKHRRLSALFVCGLFTAVTLTVLIYELIQWMYPGKIAPNVFTVLVEIVTAVLTFIIYRVNRDTLKSINLGRSGFVRYLPAVLGIIAVLVGVLCAIKGIVISFSNDFFAENSTFFDWARLGKTSMLLYPLTVIYQEFMTRCLAPAWLKTVFEGLKYKNLLAIIISSLIFSVLHIAYGFPMMLFSFCLLSVFGLMYEKINNFWLMCMIHYALGFVATVLGFI